MLLFAEQFMQPNDEYKYDERNPALYRLCRWGVQSEMLKHLLFCSGWSKRIAATAAAAAVKHYVLHTLCVWLNFFLLFRKGKLRSAHTTYTRCRQRTIVPMQASYFMIEMWQQQKSRGRERKQKQFWRRVFKIETEIIVKDI